MMGGPGISLDLDNTCFEDDEGKTLQICMKTKNKYEVVIFFPETEEEYFWEDAEDRSVLEDKEFLISGVEDGVEGCIITVNTDKLYSTELKFEIGFYPSGNTSSLKEKHLEVDLKRSSPNFCFIDDHPEGESWGNHTSYRVFPNKPTEIDPILLVLNTKGVDWLIPNDFTLGFDGILRNKIVYNVTTASGLTTNNLDELRDGAIWDRSDDPPITNTCEMNLCFLLDYFYTTATSKAMVLNFETTDGKDLGGIRVLITGLFSPNAQKDSSATIIIADFLQGSINYNSIVITQKLFYGTGGWTLID